VFIPTIKTTTTVDNKNVSTTTVYFSDLQSEEKRDILCELTVNQIKEETKEYIPILRATLNYFHAIHQERKSVTLNTEIIRVQPNAGVLKEMKVNTEIDKQKNRLLVAESITKANNQAQSNQLKEARQTLADAMSTINKSPSQNDPFCKNLVKDLQISLDGLRDRDEYMQNGNKNMNAYSNAHGKQRANLQSSSTYETSNRKHMKSKVSK